MQNLDSAVLATALPAMARDLGEDPARLGAAITSYLVALTVFIPFSAWVADRFGAKRVFMLAILVFVVASVLCGRAQGLGELIGFRILQGVGGAMMVPVGPAAAAARGAEEGHAVRHGLADHAGAAGAGDRAAAGRRADRPVLLARGVLDQRADRADRASRWWRGRSRAWRRRGPGRPTWWGWR